MYDIIWNGGWQKTGNLMKGNSLVNASVGIPPIIGIHVNVM